MPEPTGRELDREVAERVMGWEREPAEYIDMPGMMSSNPNDDRWCDKDGWGHGRVIDFVPSESWDDAGRVVEKMRADGFRLELSSNPWDVEFTRDGRVEGHGIAATAPEAICKAALAAVGGKQ